MSAQPITLAESSSVTFSRLMGMFEREQSSQLSEWIGRNLAFLSDVAVKRNKRGNTIWHQLAQEDQSSQIVSLMRLNEALNGNVHQTILFERNALGNNAFHVACERGGNVIACLEQFVPARMILNTENSRGESVLHVAVRSGNTEAMRVLRTWMQKSNVKLINVMNKRDHDGNTVLHSAVPSGNFAVLQLLRGWCNAEAIDWKELLMVQNERGLNVWHMAYKHGYDRMIQLFQKAMPLDCRILTAQTHRCETIYHLTASSGHHGLLLKLLDAAALLKLSVASVCRASTGDGDTIWHCAARNGHVKVIEKLLIFYANHGLDVQQALATILPNSDTLLYCAAASQNTEVISKLMECCDVFELPKRDLAFAINLRTGENIVHAAVRSKNDRMLKEISSLVNLAEMSTMRNEEGDNVWHVAVRGGNVDALKTMESAVGDHRVITTALTAQNSKNETVWHLAAKGGYAHIIAAMREWCKRVEQPSIAEMLNMKNIHGNTAWHTAVSRASNFEVLDALTKCVSGIEGLIGHALSDVNESGDNVWHCACKTGDDRSLNTLKKLSVAANVDLKTAFATKNELQRTPWDVSLGSSNVYAIHSLLFWGDESGITQPELHSLKINAWHTALEHNQAGRVFDRLLTLGSTTWDALMPEMWRKNIFGNTLWHAAARHGNRDALDWLWPRRDMVAQKRGVQAHEDIFQSANADGLTVYQAAVLSNDRATVDFFIERSQGEMLRNELSEELLRLSIREHKDVAMKMILEKIADRFALKQLLYFAGLAVQGAYIDTLEYILCVIYIKFGVRGEWFKSALICNKSDYNLFHISSQYESTNALKYLLNCTVNDQEDLQTVITDKNKMGDNLLEAISRRGQTETLKYIFGCISDHEIHLRDIILKKDDFEGRNLFHLAAHNGNMNTVKYLMNTADKVGINVREMLLEQDHDGCSIVHLSAWNGHLNLLKYLLNKTVELEINLKDVLLEKNGDGSNIFHLSAWKGHSEILQYLIKHTIDVGINLKDVILDKEQDGSNIFHLSAWNGHLVSLKYLVYCAKACGLNPREIFQIRNNQGNTVFQIATGEIIKYLETYDDNS